MAMPATRWSASPMGRGSKPGMSAVRLRRTCLAGLGWTSWIRAPPPRLQGARLLGLQLGQHAGKRVGVNSQQFGGSTFVAPGGLQGLVDSSIAEPVEIHERQRRVAGSGRLGMGQNWGTVEYVRLLNNVRQLPHIARPGELAEAFECLGVGLPERPAISLGTLSRKEIDEFGNILHAIAQGWNS